MRGCDVAKIFARPSRGSFCIHLVRYHARMSTASVVRPLLFNTSGAYFLCAFADLDNRPSAVTVWCGRGHEEPVARSPTTELELN